MKFQLDSFNSVQLTEWTKCPCLCYKGNNLIKKKVQELWFLCMTRLNVLNKCMKFRRNISNGIQFIERAGFCDRHTDARGKQYISPDPSRGRHNITLK